MKTFARGSSAGKNRWMALETEHWMPVFGRVKGVDMLDFLDGGMRAAVRNRLDGANGHLLTLASTGIGSGALSTDRQSTFVTNSSITSDAL